MGDEKNLQLENGNYTRIINRVLDELVKVSLLGAELATCLFIIRKTWGFNKKDDEISLTQFQAGIGRSRPTVVKALKNLQLVNMVLLAKGDPAKGQSNRYSFNKYYKTWGLVKGGELVKENALPSKEKLKKLVKTPLHTKDNTKDNTKERVAHTAPTPSQTAKVFFKGIKDLMEKTSTPEANDTRAFLQNLSEKYPGAKKEVIWQEIQKFYLYWTELNGTGTKERWHKEKAFQVDRRLVTWFGKIAHLKQSSNNYQSKGRGLVE